MVNLKVWRPGQKPCPRIQAIAQRTLAVNLRNKSWRLQEQLFHQLDRPYATTNKRSTQNTEEKIKTSIAASPSLSRAWRLRASSAHSREAESDSLLDCAAKKNRDCRRRARDDARRRAHLLSSGTVSALFCEMLRFSDLTKFEHNTWFPDGTQSRIFPRNGIDFQSSRKKKSI